MRHDDFWTTVREKGGTDRPAASGGALRAALVFAAVVIVAALVAGPLLGDGSQRLMAARGQGGYDMLTTGSVPTSADRTYTLRRSVTQPMPDALCIIDEHGGRHGDC